MLCCSWSRSFLMPIPVGTARPCSVRRALRLLRAARSRWPDGRLVRDGIGLHWMVPRGVDGADLSGAMVWDPPRSRFKLVRLWPDPEGKLREAIMDDLMRDVVARYFEDGLSVDEVRAAVEVVRADGDLARPVWRLEMLN